MNYSYWLHPAQIRTLREVPYIADILDSRGHIQSISESKILQWHYWVVPGVITEDIARILAWFSPTISLETHFKKTLTSGNLLGFGWGKEEPEIYIPGEKKTEIIATANVDGYSIQRFSPQEYEYIPSDSTTLDEHLLQSWDFRLASGATQIDSEWYFSGHYTIPEDHPFLTEEWLPFPFMKEVANQIISLAASLQSNPNGAKNGSTILLNSHITRDRSNDEDITITGWSSLLITGKAWPDPENPKRNVVAEYMHI